MFRPIVAQPPSPVNPAPRRLTRDEYLVALDAINATFSADCAALKDRYPMPRRRWPAEALKKEAAIQARFDEAMDNLFEFLPILERAV